MILEDKKISHAHVLVGLDNIVQMAILPKAIYRFNKIPIKSLMWFFIDLERIILNFIWKMDKSWIPKMILNNKKTSGGITIPHFKSYYRDKVVKTHEIALKSNLVTNGIELNTQTYTQTHMDTWFFL